jgi:hypothetical protein
MVMRLRTGGQPAIDDQTRLCEDRNFMRFDRLIVAFVLAALLMAGSGQRFPST